MADKITQQIIDALAKAAAHPDGLPLYSSKAIPGLFPNTIAAKAAAQKCLGDALVSAVKIESAAKTARDRYILTEKGWDFLLAEVNPRQVLEDFVRVLEERRGEVGELLDTARRMADSLEGLRDAVKRVLPVVTESRLRVPNPTAAFPVKERVVSPSPRGGGVGAGSWGSPDPIPTAVAVMDAEPATDPGPSILARLADWSGPTDCALPELFASLSVLDSPPTIGQFHDALRRLHAEGAIALHSWTGPLYAMPEPAYALLVGHGIAYYASMRRGQWPAVSGQ